MPFLPHHTEHPHHFHMPHVGMRKIKSVLAIFLGFWLWQGLRLLIPGLEVHPIFIYMYGMIEIRETSDKTKDYGNMRIRATAIAILIGLPFMLLTDLLRNAVAGTWLKTGMEITFLMAGVLLVLNVAQWANCRPYAGLTAAIYMILMLSHFESHVYLYSIMRAFQTVIGVAIAWFVNVKLLPYPPKPGSLSAWVTSHWERTKEGENHEQ